MPSPLRCSVCGRAFDPSRSPAMPFCSQRCREIDLGRWLGEQYGIPLESEADHEGDAADRRDTQM